MFRAIHSDQVREHGGSLGLRDAGLLESALARPMNRFQYQEDADLCDLAAAYGVGIARNHPFVDGNQRVAFQAMYVFLGLNRLRIDAAEEEVAPALQLHGWCWSRGYAGPARCFDGGRDPSSVLAPTYLTPGWRFETFLPMT